MADAIQAPQLYISVTPRDAQIIIETLAKNIYELQNEKSMLTYRHSQDCDHYVRQISTLQERVRELEDVIKETKRDQGENNETSLTVH